MQPPRSGSCQGAAESWLPVGNHRCAPRPHVDAPGGFLVGLTDLSHRWPPGICICTLQLQSSFSRKWSFGGGGRWLWLFPDLKQSLVFFWPWDFRVQGVVWAPCHHPAPMRLCHSLTSLHLLSLPPPSPFIPVPASMPCSLGVTFQGEELSEMFLLCHF